MIRLDVSIDDDTIELTDVEFKKILDYLRSMSNKDYSFKLNPFAGPSIVITKSDKNKEKKR